MPTHPLRDKRATYRILHTRLLVPPVQAGPVETAKINARGIVAS